MLVDNWRSKLGIDTMGSAKVRGFTNVTGFTKGIGLTKMDPQKIFEAWLLS